MTLILKWHESTNHETVNWFIRGIDEDGHYYGEITSHSPDMQIDIDGLLDSVEARRVHDNARLIRADGFLAQQEWKGLLAEGPVHNPTMLLHYMDGDETKKTSAKLFLEIIDIMKIHLQRTGETPAS